MIAPLPYFTGKWFPEWWVRQMLRISLRLVHGQTGPRRVSAHTPAEVVAQGGDTERVVILADNLVDQFLGAFALITMTMVSRTVVPGLFFAATIIVSGLTATLHTSLVCCVKVNAASPSPPRSGVASQTRMVPSRPAEASRHHVNRDRRCPKHGSDDHVVEVEADLERDVDDEDIRAERGHLAHERHAER